MNSLFPDSSENSHFLTCVINAIITEEVIKWALNSFQAFESQDPGCILILFKDSLELG